MIVSDLNKATLPGTPIQNYKYYSSKPSDSIVLSSTVELVVVHYQYCQIITSVVYIEEFRKW